MDLHLRHAAPTDDERAAVDALLGPPRSAWDGGERGDRARRARRDRRARGARAATSAAAGAAGAAGARRLDQRDGTRLRLHATRRSAGRRVGRRDVLRAAVDDAARAARAARLRRHRVSLQGRGGADRANSNAKLGRRMRTGRRAIMWRSIQTSSVWMRSPCLGLCDHAPAAFVQRGRRRADERVDRRDDGRSARSPCCVPRHPRDAKSRRRSAGRARLRRGDDD